MLPDADRLQLVLRWTRDMNISNRSASSTCNHRRFCASLSIHNGFTTLPKFISGVAAQRASHIWPYRHLCTFCWALRFTLACSQSALLAIRNTRQPIYGCPELGDCNLQLVTSTEVAQVVSLNL
eukprot:6185861-Pleurochrysis_carterae.AAC.2